MLRTETIRDCRERLNGLNLVLDTTLCAMGSALLISDSLDEKIDIGTAMGRLAAIAERLWLRQNELLDLHPKPRVLSVQNEPTLYSLLERATQEANAYPRSAHLEVLDAPTQILIQELEHELSYWRWHRIAGFPYVPTLCWTSKSMPARPQTLRYSDERIFNIRTNQDLVDQPEQWRRFLHYVLVDVEISAMEVCAIMMLQNRNMPPNFRLDLCRQIWDEGRHAVVVRDLLHKAGGKPGDYTYNSIVLHRLHSLDTLAEQLASQQVIQEGNALEMNQHLIETLRKGGLRDAAEAFEFINADECEHVRIGNRWLRHLVGDGTSYVDTLKTAAQTIQVPAEGKGAWNSELRRISGAPEFFVQSVENK